MKVVPGRSRKAVCEAPCPMEHTLVPAGVVPLIVESVFNWFCLSAAESARR